MKFSELFNAIITIITWYLGCYILGYMIIILLHQMGII
jgi:hypothetical protein